VLTFFKSIKTNESNMTIRMSNSNPNDYPIAPAVAIIDSADDNVYARAHLLLASNIRDMDSDIIVLVTEAISIPLDPWDKTLPNNTEATPARRPRKRYVKPLSTMPAVLAEDPQEKKARRRVQRRVKMTLSFVGGTFIGAMFLGPIGLAVGGVSFAAISRTASKIGERLKDRRVKVLMAQYNESITENNGNQNQLELSEQELVLRPSTRVSPSRN
jgi:hypothetical protein